MSAEVDSVSILRSLGVGATSEVFEAKASGHPESFALKLFNPFVTGQPEILERLKDEVAVLEKLVHPNVVRLLGVRQYQGRFALDLEFVDGMNLRDWMKARHGLLELIEVRLYLLAQIARGLGAAHEQQILHRDLKPENVLVGNEGEVKITDFGLARSIDRYTFTRSGFLVGSLGYMAPEVLNGNRASERSDIFSFGVIAYELLSGKNPFPTESPQRLLMSVANGQFEPLGQAAPHLPLEISELIDACLRPDPEQRPANIWIVEGRIMSMLAGSGVLKWMRELCRRSPSLRVLESALAEKHSRLTEQLETAASGRASVQIWSELRRLFPDDPRAQRPPVLKSSPRRPLPLLWVGVIPLIAAAGILSWWIGSRPASPGIEVPAAVLPTPILPETAAAPAEKPKPKEVTRTGYLRFAVPEDVQVFVDDHEVSPSRRGRYALAPGKHHVRLVKEGYLPIENEVTVRNAQVTVVRAGDSP